MSDISVRVAADADSTLPSGLGDRLRALRLESGYTLRELGTRLQVSPSFLSLLERELAHPSLHTVLGLMREFDVSADYLLGLTPRCGMESLRRNRREITDDNG